MELFVDKKILTVSQLTTLVREVVEDNFAQVWVEGEISNFSAPTSGHWYFTLKDSGAQLRAVMFRASTRMHRFRPKDGMAITARGRLTVYDQRGDYQLVVDYLEPKGVGALQLAFAQLKERLTLEGLFAETHKKPLPELPQRIGIVTSATGAAIHDMLHVLNRRFANLQILLYPVRVQGEGAAAEIATAIDDFNRFGQVDVLIVGRGGGSLEDLWAFNEEVVARAIYRSRLPVISAVGHETDVTIADFVADLRAPTPSAAAELVVRNKAELISLVEQLSHRLLRAMDHRLQTTRERLDRAGRSLRRPSTLLQQASQRLDDLSQRLERGMLNLLQRSRTVIEQRELHLKLREPRVELERRRERLITLTGRLQNSLQVNLDRRRERLAVGSARLDTLSPLRTLGRGYALARRIPDGMLLRDSGQVQSGDRLDLLLSRGQLRCRVEEIHPQWQLPAEPAGEQ